MGIYGDFEYVEKNGYIELAKYLGNEECPEIPEIIGGKRVSGIGAGAFEDCKSLTVLEVPQWIFYIGKSAFRNCHNLKEARLHTGVRTELAGEAVVENIDGAGESRREGAADAREVLQESTIGTPGTHEIRHEEGVRKLGDQAFADCENLELFEAKGCFCRVSFGMFQNCRNLKRLTLPGSLEEIDLFAFQGCVNLEDVILLGRSLCFVSETVFEDCKKIRLSYDSKIYKYEELGDFLRVCAKMY